MLIHIFTVCVCVYSLYMCMNQKKAKFTYNPTIITPYVGNTLSMRILKNMSETTDANTKIKSINIVVRLNHKLHFQISLSS